MKLKEVRLDGFGRLVDRTFEFAEGLNLIFGLNETGKSTLQRAIVALLYGFFNEGRVGADDRDILTAFKPWENQIVYSGSLIYALDDGQLFRVVREFEPKHATALFIYPDNSEISHQFKRQAQGRLFFADKQLGMSKRVFENTCYIHQAELIALGDSANAITDALMRLSAASTDTTSSSAIALLDTAFKEQVGTDRARTKPLPQLRQRLTELEMERRQLLEKRRELFAKMVELNQIQTELDQINREAKKLHYQKILAEHNELRQQLAIASEVAAEVSQAAAEMAKWEIWANFPVDRRDEILELRTQRNTFKTDLGQAKVEESETEYQALIAEIAKVEARITDLADARSVHTGALNEVQGLANRRYIAQQTHRTTGERWQKAQSDLKEKEQLLSQEKAQLGSLQEIGHGGLAQLQHQWMTTQSQLAKAAEKLTEASSAWGQVAMTEAEFLELEHQAQSLRTGVVALPQPRRGCRLFAAKQPTLPVVQLPTELKIYEDVKPFYTELTQTRAVVREQQAALLALEADIRAKLNGLEGRALNESLFTELNQRLDQYQQFATEVAQQQKTTAIVRTEMDRAYQEADQLQTTLQTTLEKLGLETTDLEVALRIYIKRCEQKAQLERELATLKNLQLQEINFKQQQDKQRALAEVETRMIELLGHANIICTAETLETALAQFEEGVKNHQSWAKAHQAYEAVHRRQQTTSSTESYEKSLNELEDQLTQIRMTQPLLAELQAEESVHAYASRHQEVEQKLVTAQRKYYDLKNDLNQIMGNVRHPAEIEEETSQVKARLQRLGQYGNLLTLAKEELTQATEIFQKQFAPKLEALVSEGLDRITGGRYTEVRVDPTTLAVSVTAPELGHVVSVERLSTGTRELVYLILRVSLARLMSHTGETLPLLLDDPLVQCDRSRQEQALNFLTRLAEETQVFLFTKDEWVKRWFEEQWAKSPRHQLHVLE